MLITCWCFSSSWAVLTRSQGLFNFSYCPASKEAGDAQEAGKGYSQGSWPKLTKGIFRTIWRHAEHINWGELSQGWRLLGDWLDISQRLWAIALCITCFVYSIFSPFLFCPIKLSLSQSTSFAFFPILSPIAPGTGSEWKPVCCSAGGQAKPKQSHCSQWRQFSLPIIFENMSSLAFSFYFLCFSSFIINVNV